MISPVVTKLVRTLQSVQKREQDVARLTEKIRVNKMVSKLAFFYEKIRNTLDYGDEHLIRKNTIERILKRRLIENVTGSDISRFLINELIRGGYIEDDTLPETKIHEVAQVINKYIVLRNNIIDRFPQKTVMDLYKWSLGLMACEVEECLVDGHKVNAYIEGFYRSAENRVKLKDQKIISKRDLGLQMYIAIVRLLTKSDDAMLQYRLFKLYYPDWKTPEKDFIISIARRSVKIRSTITEQLQHPMGKFLQIQLRPYAVRFRILKYTIQDNFAEIEQILCNRDDFSSEVKKVCNGLYKKIRGKLRRSVIRSIVYIFITKMVLAFILEMPYDLYAIGHIDYIPLYINILFPPVLLFLITMTARVPSNKNTDSIITGINEIVYGDNAEKSICEIKRSYNRSGILDNFFKGMYLVTFCISYGLIIWVLYKLNFNIVSGGLFLLFLSLVSYFGIRVRRLSKEFVVIARKENLLTFILDIFSYPIIRVGQWISDKSAKVNIFIFILDVIIEAPFKTLLEIFDQWSSFIKEKRDEIL